MSALFSPLSLRGNTLANRIVVSPMCQYSAEDGRASDWHLIHLGQLAISGVGMIILEATGVEPEGRITPRCLGLWDDACERALARVMTALRRHSKTAIAVQLAHAGRKASCRTPWEGGTAIAPEQGGWRTVAPSAVPHRPDDPTPAALDAGGPERVRAAFAAAARRAARLGIDGIELHGAHGYLLHQFLSPLANRRDDGYGGSLANRMRFPLEVFDAVRAAFPADRPVGMRVSATDWAPGGWDLEQTLAFAAQLKARGADWIDVSSGGLTPAQKLVAGPGYQVPFAAAIKQATGLTTMAVGLITEPQQAEDIVASGKADLVALARGLLYDPRWAWHAAAALGAAVDAPQQYWRARPSGQKNLFGAAAAASG
jgi:NADPH2 dehydrogenase